MIKHQHFVPYLAEKQNPTAYELPPVALDSIAHTPRYVAAGNGQENPLSTNNPGRLAGWDVQKSLLTLQMIMGKTRIVIGREIA